MAAKTFTLVVDYMNETVHLNYDRSVHNVPSNQWRMLAEKLGCDFSGESNSLSVIGKLFRRAAENEHSLQALKQFNNRRMNVSRIEGLDLLPESQNPTNMPSPSSDTPSL